MPRLVHGFGPLPAEAWTWFGARFGELCDAWDVPDLAAGILDSPFVELCPPSLQRDAVAAFTHRIPMRPGSGDVAPGEQLPWSAEQLAALPHEHTVHLTLGTLFHTATNVFETALAGLEELPVNVLVTVGPGADPASLGPRPPHVLVADFAPHELLLPHCTAIISQGGPATILAALDHGLPHLVLPQGADQFMNAPVLVSSGAGLALMPPEATAERVAEATTRLLGRALASPPPPAGCRPSWPRCRPPTSSSSSSSPPSRHADPAAQDCAAPRFLDVSIWNSGLSGMP